MEKKKVNPVKITFDKNIKDTWIPKKPNKWIKPLNYDSQNESLRVKSVDAAYQLLLRNMKRGFNPKYYIVSHFNDGGNNPRIQKRRLNPIDVDRDLLEVKKKLLTNLYGNNWETMRNRCRCFFTIEYGNSKKKPHFNLLLEKPPKLYDNIPYLKYLFDSYLPRKVKCLLRDTGYVDYYPQHSAEMRILNKYCNKENNILNQSIPVKVNDYIRNNRKTY